MRRWRDDWLRFRKMYWSTEHSDPELRQLLIQVDTYYTLPEGTPIPASIVQSLQSALWVKKLQRLVPIFDALEREGVFAFAVLTAAESARALREATTAWIRQFYALTPSPRAQGHHAGMLIGRAYGEVLRSAVEAIAVESAGRVIMGTRAAEQLAGLAREKSATGAIHRPPDWEDTAKGWRRKVPTVGALVDSVVTKGIVHELSNAERFGAAVLRRLGNRAPELVQRFDASDWAELLAKAKGLNPARGWH